MAPNRSSTLLYVTGFDSAAGRFSYSVNERFGATYGSATAYRPPFQIGFQVGIAIGPDRQRQALDAMRSGGAAAVAQLAQGGTMGGQGAFGGPAVNPMEMLNRVERALPNPAGAVLELRDSIRLDSSQVALLIPLRDSLAAHTTQRIDSLRQVIQREGNNPANLMRLMPTLRPVFTAARNEINSTLVSVRAILTEEQWARVPDTIKSIGAQGVGPMLMGPGQGPRDGPRPRP